MVSSTSEALECCDCCCCAALAAYGRHRPYAWLGRPGSCRRTIAIANRPGRSVPEPRSPDRKRHHRTNHHHHCRKPRTRRLRTDRRIAIQSGARPWLCPYARRRWQACSSRHRPWIERRRVHRYRWFRRWLGSRKRWRPRTCRRSGRSNWPCKRPCISSNTESLRRRAGSGHRRIAWS